MNKTVSDIEMMWPHDHHLIFVPSRMAAALAEINEDCTLGKRQENKPYLVGHQRNDGTWRFRQDYIVAEILGRKVLQDEFDV